MRKRRCLKRRGKRCVKWNRARKRFYYPTVREVIATNKMIIKNIRVDKRDRFLIRRNKQIINTIIEEAKKKRGNVYDKATLLLKRLTQAHIFQSANRRTAYSVTQGFLLENIGEGPWFKMNRTTEVLKKLRLGEYSDAQIKRWFKTGDI